MLKNELHEKLSAKYRVYWILKKTTEPLLDTSQKLKIMAGHNFAAS